MNQTIFQMSSHLEINTKYSQHFATKKKIPPENNITKNNTHFFQRWRRADRRVHLAEHRAGADAVRGGGGCLPDCEDPQNTATRHGAD